MRFLTIALLLIFFSSEALAGGSSCRGLRYATDHNQSLEEVLDNSYFAGIAQLIHVERISHERKLELAKEFSGKTEDELVDTMDVNGNKISIFFFPNYILTFRPLVTMKGDPNKEFKTYQSLYMSNHLDFPNEGTIYYLRVFPGKFGMPISNVCGAFIKKREWESLFPIAVESDAIKKIENDCKDIKGEFYAVRHMHFYVYNCYVSENECYAVDENLELVNSRCSLQSAYWYTE